MSHDLWTAVDAYITETLVQPDAIFAKALAENAKEGLPAIDVAPNQGKLLHILALIQGARRILEIGTLGGYSTLWLAQALPVDGRLITLELNAKHARVAARNIQQAGLSERVQILTEPALESLQKMQSAGEAPFDLVFIDADKPNNPAYLDWAIKLSRPGTLILCDNVIRDGEIVNANSTDPRVIGTRAMFAKLAGDSRLTATAVQTVGSKGYDGLAIAVVNGRFGD